VINNIIGPRHVLDSYVAKALSQVSATFEDYTVEKIFDYKKTIRYRRNCKIGEVFTGGKCEWTLKRPSCLSYTTQIFYEHPTGISIPDE
jgi:hypothetical protein